jgi:magnesium chelatase family protein
MDRMDIFINVPQVKYEKLITPDEENSSPKIRERVKKARQVQKARFSSDMTNSEIDVSQIKKYCRIDAKSHDLLRKYVDSGRLSVRGYHRVLKVARTIADLANSENILHDHVSEALMYRTRED